MTLLNLSTATVSKSTVGRIDMFVYKNRNELSNELKMFYKDVAGLISIQLRKSTCRRMTIEQILERAYNIEKYVLASGAASFETIYI